jgi:hypothetical protein
MKTIQITPPVQILLVLAALAAIAAVLVGNRPEIERYLKVKAM